MKSVVPLLRRLQLAAVLPWPLSLSPRSDAMEVPVNCDFSLHSWCASLVHFLASQLFHFGALAMVCKLCLNFQFFQGLINFCDLTAMSTYFISVNP
jgi:hypothetical protein